MERMEEWFFQQFEDPQIETPRDGEDQTFIYPWGGPFEASDVLHGAFGHEFDEAWIVEAAERVERDGTVEWAPTSTGEYYEHPDSQGELEQPRGARLTSEILARLNALEAIVAALPTMPSNVGHNSPPEEIGLPPYTDEDARDVAAAIADTRAELAEPAPDAARLTMLSKRFEGWGAKIGKWVASKGDLAVDEVIKTSIKAVTWTSVLGLLGEIAHNLLKLARELLAAR